MNVLSQPVANFVLTCYCSVAIALTGSLIYIALSKNHTLSFVIALIYFLEIASQVSSIAALRLPVGKVTLVNLFSVSAYSSHWIAIGLFTGEYIKVATQIPLLQ